MSSDSDYWIFRCGILGAVDHGCAPPHERNSKQILAKFLDRRNRTGQAQIGIYVVVGTYVVVIGDALPTGDIDIRAANVSVFSVALPPKDLIITMIP